MRRDAEVVVGGPPRSLIQSTAHVCRRRFNVTRCERISIDEALANSAFHSQTFVLFFGAGFNLLSGFCAVLFALSDNFLVGHHVHGGSTLDLLRSKPTSSPLSPPPFADSSRSTSPLLDTSHLGPWASPPRRRPPCGMQTAAVCPVLGWVLCPGQARRDEQGDHLVSLPVHSTHGKRKRETSRLSASINPGLCSSGG